MATTVTVFSDSIEGCVNDHREDCSPVLFDHGIDDLDDDQAVSLSFLLNGRSPCNDATEFSDDLD